MAGAVMLSGKPVWLGLIGMFLLQINFLLDAVDGEVARLRGEAGRLSGEYLDKLCDHLPKTAMYFCWGYGTFHLTGSQIPLICGFALSAWNIIPRFCGVETLLERLDKAPEVYDNQEFHQALKKSFAIRPERGRVDYLLTLFVHPAVNALTLFFLLEAIFPVWNTSGFNLSSRYLFILLYSLISLANLVRKGIRYFKILNF
jgi:hypothetical protein